MILNRDEIDMDIPLALLNITELDAFLAKIDEAMALLKAKYFEASNIRANKILYGED
jgi:hypothetical protein